MALLGFGGVLLLSASAHAQTDLLPPPPLTWDDAPPTSILRHEGDALVRLGRYTPQQAVRPFTSTNYDVGDVTTFNIITADDPHPFELYYRSQYADFWFMPNSIVDQAALEAAALRFDTDIWPTNRVLFGDTLTLEGEGAARLNLVHLESLYPGLAGFFNPDDQCAQAICPRSNQRNILYMMLDYGPLNSDLYLSTITHEFQHLLQFNLDGNEYRWLDEGYSQLAEHVQGFSTDPINLNNIERYLQNMNLVLNGWSTDYDTQSAHYGAGYLMMVYLYEQFGADFVRALTHHPADGLAGIHQTLQATHSAEGVDAVIVNWWAANYLNDPALLDGRYGYLTLTLPEITSIPLMVSNEGAIREGVLLPYGVEYLHIETPGDYHLSFSASVATDLIRHAQPHSGNAAWWSNNATAAATTLTRTIDLTSLERATLKYWLLGETGNFSGHLHVLASQDGMRWDVLRGNNMDLHNRFSAAPGPHYTHTDGEWIADFVDLTSYAGDIVQVRFEYVTNNALAGPGFLLDDLAIPELGWSDDVESGANGWIVEGFIRTNGQVAQNWALALINPTAPTAVQSIVVAEGHAQTTINVPEGGATLLVGSLAPITHIPSPYRIVLTPP